MPALCGGGPPAGGPAGPGVVGPGTPASSEVSVCTYRGSGKRLPGPCAEVSGVAPLTVVTPP